MIVHRVESGTGKVTEDQGVEWVHRLGRAPVLLVPRLSRGSTATPWLGGRPGRLEFTRGEPPLRGRAGSKVSLSLSNGGLGACDGVGLHAHSANSCEGLSVQGRAGRQRDCLVRHDHPDQDAICPEAGR